MAEQNGAPAIEGVLETSLYARDLKRTAAFYRDLFGFKALVDSPRLIAFEIARRSVLLVFQAGATEQVVTHQLREGLSKTPNLISTDFLLAYEPVWAIGTGLTASAGDASAIHTLLRSQLREMIGTRCDEIPILYGGSVNVENAAGLLAAPEVDGLLVGGASVEASSWLAIAKTR